MDYLASQNVIDCKEISLALIHAYIKTLAGYAYKTVEQNICSMRAFFRFLLETEEVQTDFAAKTPMVQARKQIRIPSVWTADKLKKLIATIHHFRYSRLCRYDSTAVYLKVGIKKLKECAFTFMEGPDHE